ncbi:YfzA family protein [Bacillus kwashiorkori]|uniref:YfzA family protein n=1 Tax=Bacillus kwashiorkori TaxID=1522318 RepID=UPI00078231FA
MIRNEELVNEYWFFLFLHFILIMVDNTPFVNEFEFGNFGNEMLQTKIFTEWFNFYDTPFFNVVLFFSLIHLITFPFYWIIFKKRTVK